MGLMVGMVAGAVLLIGLAWIAFAAPRLQEETPIPSRASADEQPVEIHEGSRSCGLCGSDVLTESGDPGCPLIEAFGIVRAESMKLDGKP